MARLAYYTPGPVFLHGHDGTPMFAHQIDASNSIGPRKATDEDKAKYPEAWGAFEASQAMRVNPEAPEIDIRPIKTAMTEKEILEALPKAVKPTNEISPSWGQKPDPGSLGWLRPGQHSTPATPQAPAAPAKRKAGRPKRA